jgi:hypothetical protein
MSSIIDDISFGWRYDLEDRDHLASLPRFEFPEWQARKIVIDPSDAIPPEDQNGQGSCFPTGTHILMADETLRPIEKVSVGDLVVTHKNRVKEVTKLFRRKFTGIMPTFGLPGSTHGLYCTPEHPIWIDSLDGPSWISASKVTKADSAIARFPAATRQVRVPVDPCYPRECSEEDVFNLEVADDNSYVANCVVVHNCTGHGMTCAGNTVVWLQSGGRNVIRLSREAAYILGQRKVGITGDQGCTGSGVVKAAMDDGLALESVCPYPSHYDPECITQAVLDDAAQRKIKKCCKLRNYDDIFRWIATGQGAVVYCIWWTEELAENTSGIITGCSGRRLGGHCVCLFGLSAKEDESHRQWPLLRNSHRPRGQWWGSGGTAAVSPAVIDEQMADNFTEAIGVTDLEDHRQGPGRLVFCSDNPW